MPVVKSPQPQLEYSRFSLWGESYKNGYVFHVGLCKESGNSFLERESLPVYHMMPPLSDKPISIGKRDFLVPCAWTSEQTERMDLFIADTYQMMGEKRLSCSKEYFYCVYPHCKILSKDNRIIRKYSCVGFVLEAFSSADIRLFLTDSSNLPLVSKNQLIDLFPFYRDCFAESAADFFQDYERGEWPVVLPGYAVQGLLCREQDPETDYCPDKGDESLR